LKKGALWLLALFIIFLFILIPALWISKQNNLITEKNQLILNKDRQLLALIDSQDSMAAEMEEWKQLYTLIEAERNALAIEQPRVYLTFDDGPSSITAGVLDILKLYNVKASFFVVGANPTEYKEQMMRRIINEGHSLGNHSYTHDYSKIYASKLDFWKDFKKMEDYLYEVAGIRPILVRFPGGSRGSYNYRSMAILEGLRRDMDRLGYIYVDWNVLGGDLESDDPQYLIEQVLSQVKGRHNATVLFHDTASNEEILEALPAIIESLQQQGYQFARLDPCEAFIRY